MKQNKVIGVDLFAGAGGASTALIAACKDAGVQLELLAINHWPIAVDTHTKNHPTVRHLCESVESVDPREQFPKGRVHILLAGPECFPAGTLILTKRGLIPIEAVEKQDMVLTHRGRWRSVTETMSAIKDTIVVRGTGHYGLETTDRHPFLTRSRKKRWPRANRNGVWVWTKPQWTAAGTTAGNFWATPATVPELPVPMGMLDSPTSAFWWIVGRWLGDGSVDDRPAKGGSIQIACSDSEADDLLPKLKEGLPKNRWTRRRTRTAVLFETHHKELVRWLVEHFGKLAHGKTVPAWALGMPVEWRDALLAGYCSADGHDEGRKQDTCTVSKRLAIGLRLLAESLDHRAALYKAPQHATEIEGRKVNVRDIHRVKWTHDRKRSFNLAEDGIAWSRVRSVGPGRKAVEVFNLSVEEDESYVADGIIVHNCTHFSTARGGRPVNPQSRASAWNILKWVQELYIDTIIIENVPEFKSWGPIGANQKPLKSKRGETYKAFLEALRSFGYRVEDRIINSADYGDPTTRRRLFIFAHRGRNQICWPAPSHSKNGMATLLDANLNRWATARENVIDWSIKGKSIFTRKKPLRPATMARILAGLEKFGGPELKPFLIVLRQHVAAMSVDGPISVVTATGTHHALVEPVWKKEQSSPQACLIHTTHGGRVNDVDGPTPTITGANRGEIAVAEAFLLQQQSGGVPRETGQPVPTIASGGAISLVEPFLICAGGPTGQGRTPNSVDEPYPSVLAENHRALIEPYLVDAGFGAGSGETARWGAGCYSTDQPLGVVPGSNRFAIAEPVLVPLKDSEGEEAAAAGAYLTKYYGTALSAQSVDDPVDTLTAKDRLALVEPFLISAGGPKVDAIPVNQPANTVLARDHMALVETEMIAEAFISPQRSNSAPRSPDEPIPTLTGGQHMALIEPFLFANKTNNAPKLLDEPIPTIAGNNPVAMIEPFLLQSGGQGEDGSVRSLEDPLVTADGRVGLVQPVINGYALEIYFRMLQPHELAAAMSFPPDYKFVGNRGAVVKQIGNAWAGKVAKALCVSALQTLGKAPRPVDGKKKKKAA